MFDLFWFSHFSIFSFVLLFHETQTKIQNICIYIYGIYIHIYICMYSMCMCMCCNELVFFLFICLITLCERVCVCAGVSVCCGVCDMQCVFVLCVCV